MRGQGATARLRRVSALCGLGGFHYLPPSASAVQNGPPRGRDRCPEVLLDALDLDCERRRCGAPVVLRQRIGPAVLLPLGLLLAGTSARADASFMGLGILPGTLSSSANDVSDDGSVVVGIAPTSVSRTGGSAEGFRWTAGGGMVALGHLPGGIYSNPAAVSSDGSVIVGSDAILVGQAGGVDTRQNVPFRWTSGGGMVGLGSLGAGVPGTATGISDDGSVVVGSGQFGFSEAFRWTSSGGMVGLGDLAGGTFRSAATGVSGDGSVVVGSSSSGNVTYFGVNGEAVRWTSGGGMLGLGYLPGGG